MSINKFGAKMQMRSFYLKEEEEQDGNEYRCPICISRIDKFGYCACGSNIGVS
jgi:hypothetical protein